MKKKDLVLPEDSECACPKCASACHNRPGLFLPEELEKAASLMGMEIDKFFKSYLGVDWWEEDDDFPETFMIAPATNHMDSGDMYPGSPRGTCTLLDPITDRCKIHEAKPLECRKFLHGMSNKQTNQTREFIVKSWQNKRAMVVKLLGREPEAETYSMLDNLRDRMDGI